MAAVLHFFLITTYVIFYQNFLSKMLENNKLNIFDYYHFLCKFNGSRPRSDGVSTVLYKAMRSGVTRRHRLSRNPQPFLLTTEVEIIVPNNTLLTYS